MNIWVLLFGIRETWIMSAQPGGLCMNQCAHWWIHLFFRTEPASVKRSIFPAKKCRQVSSLAPTKKSLLSGGQKRLFCVMRSLRNVMRTACVMQASPVMHAFGACRNASYHLSQRSGITYHLFSKRNNSQCPKDIISHLPSGKYFTSQKSCFRIWLSKTGFPFLMTR